MLRALTLIRPMAAAIVHGTKRIENRPRNLPKAMLGVATVVAVHAGKKWDAEYARVVAEIDGCGWEETEYSRSRITSYQAQINDEGIVGLMLLTGRVFTENPRPGVLMKNSKVITEDDRCDCPRYCDLHTDGNYPVRVGGDRWYSGPFGYEIAAAVAFRKPLPCVGKLGFWPVPVELECAVAADIEQLKARAA